MKATQGYHRYTKANPLFSRYECEMRLYELLPMEGKEMFGYFLALRYLPILHGPLAPQGHHPEEPGLFPRPPGGV